VATTGDKIDFVASVHAALGSSQQAAQLLADINGLSPSSHRGI